jgi:hypothetical protein
MKKLTGFIIPLFLFSQLHAQQAETPGPAYSQAIGIKFPFGFSVTYKKFVTDTHNLEAQLTSWNKGFRLAGLYEFNFYTFNNIEGLGWFAGPGAHVGFWKEQYSKDYNSKADIGIDGIIGLDYKFKDIPINVSVDWEPAVTLVGTAGFTPAYGGLAVRYTF